MSFLNSRYKEQGKSFMKKLGVGGTFLLVVVVGILSGIFFLQKDTYSAEVTSAWFLDSDQGKTAKFIRVKPLDDVIVRGKDDAGVLKLKVSDSHIPFFAWATNGDRMSNLKEGDVICLTETGFRSEWFSEYPNPISFTMGFCLE